MRRPSSRLEHSVDRKDLYRLTQAFQEFYREVPVLKAETPELRAARLALVETIASTLRTGLGLLGIECPEQM